MSNSHLFEATDLFKAMFPAAPPAPELMSNEELAERMRRRDAQMHADLCYERQTEARTLALKTNPHDE